LAKVELAQQAKTRDAVLPSPSKEASPAPLNSLAWATISFPGSVQYPDGTAEGIQDEGLGLLAYLLGEGV